MKNYFLMQVASPQATLRTLISASLVTAFFGLITVGRGLSDAEEKGGLPILTLLIGIYLFVNFAGIAWAAYRKLKTDR